MSGYCPECGNTQCLCKVMAHFDHAPESFIYPPHTERAHREIERMHRTLWQTRVLAVVLYVALLAAAIVIGLEYGR